MNDAILTIIKKLANISSTITVTSLNLTYDFLGGSTIAQAILSASKRFWHVLALSSAANKPLGLTIKLFAILASDSFIYQA